MHQLGFEFVFGWVRWFCCFLTVCYPFQNCITKSRERRGLMKSTKEFWSKKGFDKATSNGVNSGPHSDHWLISRNRHTKGKQKKRVLHKQEERKLIKREGGQYRITNKTLRPLSSIFWPHRNDIEIHRIASIPAFSFQLCYVVDEVYSFVFFYGAHYSKSPNYVPI